MLKGALNSTDEGAIVISSMHLVVMANTAARRLFNLSEQEVVGWGVADLFRGREQLLEAYNNTFHKKKCEVLAFSFKNDGGLAINAKCRFSTLSITEGTSGDILLTIQSINKF